MIDTRIALSEINTRNQNALMANMGIEFTEISENHLIARMPVDHRTRQPLGILHGGASAALARFEKAHVAYLTDGAPIHPFSPAIQGLGRDLYFVRGGSIWMLDIVTLRERLVVEFPDAQLGECSLSAWWVSSPFLETLTVPSDSRMAVSSSLIL